MAGAKGEPSRFDTMPSQPSPHACLKMVTHFAGVVPVDGDAVVWMDQESGGRALALPEEETARRNARAQ
jgi:hypothetical protein